MKRALQAYLENAIPLVVAMGVTVDTADDGRVVLSAPLAPNVNHQSTAFGGSIAGLATLACWGWLWARTRSGAVPTGIVVANSTIEYSKSVTTDFTAECTAPADAVVAAFVRTLERRGRARIELAATVKDASGVVCATFGGRFVAVRAA